MTGGWLLDPRNGPAFDLPAPTVAGRTWVLASLPRSGSTLLGRLLEDTGRVGVPKEWLNPMQVRDFEARLAPSPWARARHRLLVGPLVPLAGRLPWSDERLRAYLERVRARRTGEGGWFALKIHHHHLVRWFGPQGDGIWTALHPTAWLRIRRRDRVAQAVSWLRAQQTGQWADWQRPWGRPVYHGGLLRRRLAEIDAHERGWDAFFGRAGLTPETIWYEDLVADRAAAVRRALAALGVPDADQVPVPAPTTAPQADATSAAWSARLREELAARP